MRKVIAGTAVLMVSVLLMIPAVAQESEEQNSGKQTPDECLLNGGSWSECTGNVMNSDENSVNPYSDILKELGIEGAGAGLGTLSAVQSIRKKMTQGTYGKERALQ